MAAVPKATQLGDTVHILTDARIPVVLRCGIVEVNAGRKVGYRIVGDAYVHGIVNAEACDCKKPAVSHLLQLRQKMRML
jgi:hypothetical protein